MDGKATFTMVMSRTIISIPVHSTPRATQRDRSSMALPLLDLSAHQYVEPEGPDFDTGPRILFVGCTYGLAEEPKLSAATGGLRQRRQVERGGLGHGSGRFCLGRAGLAGRHAPGLAAAG